MKKLNHLVELQKNFFKTGMTKNLSFKIKMLKRLKYNILKYEKEIIYTVKKDLNRSDFATYTSEISPILEEIDYFIKNIEKLSKPKKIKTPMLYLGYKSYEIKQPYGISLIISPWNYPFLLAIVPLIGAIATGNCAIIKVSEYAIHSQYLLKKIIDKTFPPNYCKVVLGDSDIVKDLIDSNVDFIFFTGSTNIGKKIMERASKNLIPTALELGGKSPCIIDKYIDIDKTAKRIVWGKTLNAGQTCIAPDYILVHNDIKDLLIKKLVFYTKKFWGDEPIKNSKYPKMINKKSFYKALELIKDTNIIYGGDYDKNSLKIEPTYIDNVSMDTPVMKEEIFAPIMPIIGYNSLKDIHIITSYNKNPLSMYIFSKNNKFVSKLIETISCGNVCINDTILQTSNHNLPFGGIGTSGTGSYHGKYSFELFSHKKGILKSTNLYDINIRYNNSENLKLFKYLTRR